MAVCPSCGMEFSAVAPTPEQLQEVYDQAYRPGELYGDKLVALRDMMRTGRPRVGFYLPRVFLNRIVPQPGDRLLEVGCGTGIFLAAAKARGWEVEGMDYSNEAVRASADVHGMPVRQGTLESLDFEPGAYKAIVAWEVVEHMVDPLRFLKRVRSLLRPDGVFASSVPNNSPRVPQGQGPLGIASVPPIHLNFWTCDSFRAFAIAGGFEPLYLATKRSLLDIIPWKQRPLAFAWNQTLALLGLRDGGTIFAVLAPRKTP
jgi:SAM-dependent methyltransferase